MKKVYQEIIMSFYVEDENEKDIDEILFEMDIDIQDKTGKLEENNTYIDWEYRHLMVETL
mgnify:CR=1 FL=1